MVSIVYLVELNQVRKNRIGRHLLCYKFSLINGTGAILSVYWRRYWWIFFGGDRLYLDYYEANPQVRTQPRKGC
jgi:hypothetical protein